jgi:hypothetical protein
MPQLTSLRVLVPPAPPSAALNEALGALSVALPPQQAQTLELPVLRNLGFCSELAPSGWYKKAWLLDACSLAQRAPLLEKLDMGELEAQQEDEVQALLALLAGRQALRSLKLPKLEEESPARCGCEAVLAAVRQLDQLEQLDPGPGLLDWRSSEPLQGLASLRSLDAGQQIPYPSQLLHLPSGLTALTTRCSDGGQGSGPLHQQANVPQLQRLCVKEHGCGALQALPLAQLAGLTWLSLECPAPQWVRASIPRLTSLVELEVEQWEGLVGCWPAALSWRCADSAALLNLLSTTAPAIRADGTVARCCMQAGELQGLEQLRSLSVQLPREGDADALERQLQQLAGLSQLTQLLVGEVHWQAGIKVREVARQLADLMPHCLVRLRRLAEAPVH